MCLVGFLHVASRSGSLSEACLTRKTVGGMSFYGWFTEHLKRVTSHKIICNYTGFVELIPFQVIAVSRYQFFG